MSAQRGHGHVLYYSASSPLHLAAGQVKIVGLLIFMLVVVATPGHWYAAFAGYAMLLGLAGVISRVPPTYLLPRMVVEVPVFVFAALLPFVALGPRTEILGLTVSAPGLVAAGTLLIKVTLGVVGGLLLAATTTPHDIVAGLERLRLPNTLVLILSFMVRYLELVGNDLRRQHIALVSRGFSARDPRQWPVLAKAVGALFIRSYERGERVHLAMLARGYPGTMPRL